MDRNFPRLLHTLQLIPARGKISASMLLERLGNLGYEVDARTVQRDLKSLTIPFGLECDDRNKPYGWYWANEAKRITVPGMDASQALSLRLLQTYLIDLLPESTVQDLRPYFEEASNQLTQHYGDTAVQRWLDKVAIVPASQPLLPPTVKRSVHDAVTQALLSERQLDFQYTSAGGKVAKSALASEVIYGNNGGKRSVDKTYLAQARATGRVRISPLHEVTDVGRAPDGRWQIRVNRTDLHGRVLEHKLLTAQTLSWRCTRTQNTTPAVSRPWRA